jgi:glutathione S-transferase
MAAGRFEGLPAHPHIDAYVGRLNERPALKKAQSFG